MSNQGRLSLAERLKSRIFAMPNEKFTQFHNSITATFSGKDKTTTTTPTPTNNNIIAKEEVGVNQELFEHDPTNSSIRYAYSQLGTKPRKRKRSPFECVICLSSYNKNVPHCTDKCDHKVCRDCVRQYFETTLAQRQESYETVQCPSPGCSEYFITDQVLYSFYSKSEIKKWWSSAILQSTFIDNKVNCPIPRCRAVYDVDSCLLKECTYAKCLDCGQGICITCQKPWHPDKIRFIDDEDEMRKTLKKAKDNHWTRCPKCLTIVEKVTGCSTIYCKCRTTFCYRCGGISDNHTCRNQCQKLSAEKLRSIRNPMFVVEKKQKN